jgi:hypothetical protein
MTMIPIIKLLNLATIDFEGFGTMKHSNCISKEDLEIPHSKIEDFVFSN